MFDNEPGKPLWRRMLPRIIKAVIMGLLYFVLFYAVPMLLVSQVSRFAPELFSDYGQIVTLFAAVVIFFVVAGEITSGTIFQHAFSIGRALILIIFFVVALDGGIVKLNVDVIENMPINITADLRVYLMMLIVIDLIGLAKSVLQALNFLSERTEKQLPQPQPAD